MGSFLGGLLPVLGTVAGGLFGGPVGAAIGGAAGGLFNSVDSANNQPAVPTQEQLQKDTQYNTVNPAGSSIFTTDPNTGERTNTTTYSPTNQALYEGVQGAHGTNADLAAALAGSQGGNISAGISPIGPPPKGTPGQTVIQTDPASAFAQFQNTGVLPAGYGVDSNGKLVATGQPSTTAPSATEARTSDIPQGDAPVYSPGQNYVPSGEMHDNNPDVNNNRVKPVAAQDFFAWQQAHPNGEPMPNGWTLEGSMTSGMGSTGGGSMPQYKPGTLGQTVGAAPTLGQVGSAETMGRMTGDIPQGQTVGQAPQGQTVSQAQALARLQSPEAIAAYTGNTPVGAYQGGGDIASYNAAAPKMGTTAAPGAQQQFTGTAPTPEMIANGGSVAGAGEGLMKNLDLSNLGAMPTASEATLKQVQDALYARQTGYLDPQYQAEQAQLNARLANQGIGVGARANTLSQAAEASAREKAYAGARNDAILAGGAEQSRLFNMQMAARQQGYTEDLGQGTFQNAAQGQGYAQQLANQQNVIQGTTANNAAQNAQLAAQMAIMNQNNQASQTDFQNQFNITGQNNAAQQALGQYSLGAGQLNANIGNMNAQNALGAGQLNANIGIANNAANLGAGQLNANIAQNNFANNLATSQFNNQAIQGDITNQLATTGFNNAVGQQGFQNQLASTGFNNAVGQQGFTNQLAQGTFNNAAAQQDYANKLAQQTANNTALNQGYANQIAGTGFNNTVGQQDIANQFSQQGLNINAAQAAAQMAQAKASAASAAGQASAAIVARNQANALAQQQRQDALNQQQFTNYMNVQGFNNGVTNTGNNLDLSAYGAGISGNNSNINAFNSNINALGALQNASGPVGGLPSPGGGTSSATQQGYVDAAGNWQSTNQNNNMILNAAGQLVPLIPRIINNTTAPNYNTYGTGPGSPQYGGPGGG